MPASACAAAQGRHAADRARKRDAEVETDRHRARHPCPCVPPDAGQRGGDRLEKDRRRLTCASYMDASSDAYRHMAPCVPF
jgi:hypothetical protein